MLITGMSESLMPTLILGTTYTPYHVIFAKRTLIININPDLKRKCEVYRFLYVDGNRLNVYNTIFQHSVVPVDSLICKGNLQGATSCSVRILLVCYLVTFFYKLYFYDMFRPHKIIVITALSWLSYTIILNLC
jgi:hypothetical protein